MHYRKGFLTLTILLFVLVSFGITEDYHLQYFLAKASSKANELSKNENLTLILHSISRLLCISDVKALQLDPTNTIEEQVPIIINQRNYEKITRTMKIDG